MQSAEWDRAETQLRFKTQLRPASNNETTSAVISDDPLALKILHVHTTTKMR